jgi:hypothetical protein
MRTLLDKFITFVHEIRAAHNDAPIVTVVAVTAVITRAVIVQDHIAGQKEIQLPIAHHVVSATFITVSDVHTDVVVTVSTVFEAHHNLNQYQLLVELVEMPHLLFAIAALSLIMISAVYATGIGSSSVQ